MLFLLGIWEHANGNIYSDIISVYVNRFCTPGPCATSGLPYVNYFVEYPPITGFFAFEMGVLARFIPFPGRPFLNSYYDYTSIFLFLSTIILISELLKLSDLIGIRQKHRTVFFYIVATPSFVFMLLLNWYVIGVTLTVWGIRKFLETENGPDLVSTRKSMICSGTILGLSACANLITVVPALGMLIFGRKTIKERIYFILGVSSAILCIYLPLIILNSLPHEYLNADHILVNLPFDFPNFNVITDFIKYEQNWYTEGSWMLAFFTSTNPIRHYVFPVLFTMLFGAIVLIGFRIWKGSGIEIHEAKFVVTMGGLFTFAFLFSTYVCTPQMNLVLLPFFVLIPPLRRNYWEFLAFEIVNSLVIVWGFSTPLSFLGITVPAPVAFGSPWVSPIQFLAVVRSLWIGKFLFYNGLIKLRSTDFLKKSESRATVLVSALDERNRNRNYAKRSLL